ncbi:MAG: DUF1080 domain-containing protein [Phycisphaerales bacterium]|nr:DUF1080 domain-containing protein [Phycisphaerales bacterium]
MLSAVIIAALAADLFDGQSLNEFEVIGPQAWHVEAGVIHGTGEGLTEQSWLYWPGEVEDFTLTLEFMIDAGNSGINYRARPGGHQGMSGYQADLDVDHAYTGALYDLDGRAIMTPRGRRMRFGFQDNRQDLGSCGDADALVADISPGTWHTYEITARGGHLIHRIDGRIHSETWDEDPQARYTSGGFAFQVHPGAECRVAFRNIDLLVHQSTEGLQVPEGFRATKVLEAGPEDGSWVSMAFEPGGDLLVSPQHGGIRRIDMSSGVVEPIDIDIGSAQGMVHAFEALYVVVSRDPPEGGLHRLRDTDGDGRYDEHLHLIEWGNGSEHGPHSIRVGPDGQLWVIQGNHTPLPPNADLAGSPFRRWAEDLVTERSWDANGHAVGVMSPGGVIWRTDPDGERAELIAGGQRNACDFAFTPDGACFAWDSDMEWDMGMPWYRPPRIMHIIPGADNGWRSGTGKWKDWYPDALPAVVETPPASPTALVHAGDGAFGIDWEGVLLAADWSYGRIWAVRPVAEGASYTATIEPFAQGRPFNVSAMRFGPDGALYVITGGRSTASALWKIEADEPLWVDPQVEIPPAITRRRQLESTSISLDELWALLGTGDQAMSNAVRGALDRHQPGEVIDRITRDKDAAKLLDALLWAARCSAANQLPAMTTQLATIASRHPELQARAMRVAGVAMARGASVDLADMSRLLPDLLGHADHDAQFEAAQCMARLGLLDPAFVLQQMESCEGEQALQWALLARLHSGDWTSEQELHYLRWLRRHGDLIGGRSAKRFIEQFEARFVRDMDEAHRASLLARLRVDAAEPEDRPHRPFVEHWTLDVLQVAMANAPPQGDGPELFAAARCVECHRFRGHGGSSGPDLTGVGGRFSEADLLRAIVEPDHDVSDQYAATWIETEDGLYTGRLIELDADRIVLDLDPYGPVNAKSFDRRDVLSMEPSDVSTMPPGLLNTLTPGEVRALLNWLQQR